MKNFIRNQNLLAVVVVALFAVLANLWVATFPLDAGSNVAAVLTTTTTKPTIYSINNSVDVYGTINIKGANFGSRVNVSIINQNCDDTPCDPYILKTIPNIITGGTGTTISIPVTNASSTRGLSEFLDRESLLLRVTRADNGNSVDAWIKITKGIVAEKIQILGTAGTLTRTYDSITKKETLTSKFTVRLYAGLKSTAKVRKTDSFAVGVKKTCSTIVTYFPYECDGRGGITTYAKPLGVVENGDTYIIPAGKYADFVLTTQHNPLPLFAGSYTASLIGIDFSDGVVYSSWQNVLRSTEKGTLWTNNKTNAVTVIGEKSPYITDVTVNSNPDGTTKEIVLRGSRFDTTMYVYFGGVNSYTWNSKSEDVASLTIPASAIPASKDGSTTYSVNIQVENANLKDNLSNVVHAKINKQKVVTTTSSSSVLVLFESQSSTEMTYDGANNDRAQYTIKFSIAANGGDVFVPLSASPFAQTASSTVSGAVYDIKDTNGVVTQGYGSGTLQTSSGNTIFIDGKDFVKIPEGEIAHMALAVVYDPALNGSYRLQLGRINFKAGSIGVPNAMNSVEFLTDYQTISDNTVVVATTTTASTSIVVSLASTTASVDTIDGSNNDFGTFNIKYNITAVGGDIYVPKRVVLAGDDPALGALSIRVDKSGTRVTSGVTATLQNNFSTYVSPAGNFVIPKGQTAQFVLTTGLTLPTAGTAGTYRVSVSGIAWGTSDTNPVTKVYTSNLTGFITDYQYLAQSSSILKFLGNSFLGWLGIWN